MEEAAKLFKETYHFDIDSNAVTIQNEIDKIAESIEALQDKKIEVAMDWSGVEDI
jgi:hypothetical protein